METKEIKKGAITNVRNKSYKSKYNSKNRYRHPQIQIVRKKVRRAISQGKLVKPTVCSVCGHEREVKPHLDDYLKELEVRWLCSPCQRRYHYKHGESLNADFATPLGHPMLIQCKKCLRRQDDIYFKEGNDICNKCRNKPEKKQKEPTRNALAFRKHWENNREAINKKRRKSYAKKMRLKA